MGRGNRGGDQRARIAERLPQSMRQDPDLLVVACEHGQGLALAHDLVTWVGVDDRGKRDRRAAPWSASIGDITRVLWNRIDILDRQELTIRLADGPEVTVAPLRAEPWPAIRSRLQGSAQWRAWPQATIGERLGGFLPPDPRAGREAIIYVDSDRISQHGQEFLVDGSIKARFGYRPGPAGAGGLLRGYGLQDLFSRRSPSGMEPYVRIEGDQWRLEAAISARDPAYAATLVERICDLGRQAGADAEPGPA